MPNVAESFLRGISAGNAQKAHQEQLEENKLRMQVLKHQIDGLKIQDQVRARELALAHKQMLDGLPAEQLPSENVASQQSIPAQRGLPDIVMQMGVERMGGQGAAPGFATPEAPEQFTTTQRMPQAVTIPGIDAFGIPGISVRPQSMEELLRAKMVEKFNEPFTLGPDQARFVGGEEVARGPKRTMAPTAPTRYSLALEAAGGDPAKALELTRGSEGGANVGSFEDYVLRYAQAKGKKPEQLTPADIEDARKRFQQADDRPIRINTGLGAALSPTAESNVINRLSNQWTAASKTANELERQVAIMKAGMDAARRGDLAQGAQAVLVTFQKILDPTSVVRESEFDRSAAGQSLMNRARGAAERLTRGGAGIPLPELEKFATLAADMAKAQRGSRLASIQERLGKTADRYKIPRELVFESEAAPLPAAPASSPAAPAGVPSYQDYLKSRGRGGR